MPNRLRHIAPLLAALALCGAGAGPAWASSGDPRISDASLSTPIEVTPAAPRGTVILVHGGAWAGPDREGQQSIFDFAAPVFADRGFRVVSIDYLPGADGLTSVQDAIGAELVRGTGGPLCLYGESAGGHLALLAAAAVPSVDCVMTNGAPADLAAWATETQGPDTKHAGATMFWYVVPFFFGYPGTPAFQAADPARVLPDLGGNLLAIAAEDDRMLPDEQLDILLRAVPTAVGLRAESDPTGDPARAYLHGTLSPAGVAQIHDAMGAFVERVARQDQVERRLRRRTGCGALAVDARAMSARRFAEVTACILNAAGRADRPDLRVAGWAADAGRGVAVRVGPGKLTPARAADALLHDDDALRVLHRRHARRLAVRYALSGNSRVSLQVR